MGNNVRQLVESSSLTENNKVDNIVLECQATFSKIGALEKPEKIDVINKIRKALGEYSPFSSEPVDCVQWVHFSDVVANDYNPNSVAPPEMKLLEKSIDADGYTQPIVTWGVDNRHEVIDGFHRNRVGRESASIMARLNGYLPLVIINNDRVDRGDRIASTIRHNRARGKHKVESMSEIVVELKKRNWSDEKISKNLGMEQDEILRLCQITGLSELFADQEFSNSWDVEGEITESDFQELTDDVTSYGEEADKFRTVNTNDGKRIFHTYDKWECYKAGLYNTTKEGMKRQECEEAYRDFLANDILFEKALKYITENWTHSCQHYLSNVAMNRIAWLGQAAACYAIGLPAVYRGGFSLLDEGGQKKANELALVYLNKWLVANGYDSVEMEEANSGRQSDIY